MSQAPSAAIISLGCSRNDVDSEELAGRLTSGGWQVSQDADGVDVILVNTCGFIDSAKKDSIDTLLEAAGLRDSGSAAKVVAVGCMAQRYGAQLAEALPEADAILGFDHYPEIAQTLKSILAGETIVSHLPSDRRALLPISPAERKVDQVVVPGLTPHVYRARLTDSPWAPLKIASGCDRRCTFCAIPAFRGAFVSRSPEEIIAEAQWLAENGVREVLLVSENSTSFGKDLGDIRALEKLLLQLCAIDGLDWVRVSYLQPAELRPDLLAMICQTPGIAPYLDLSFQHASNSLLRRMKRFGSPEEFLKLLEVARVLRPGIGARTNVIVGFPGETQEEFTELTQFIEAANLDVVGVFGYSDEDGTAAEKLPNKVDPEVIAQRVEEASALANRISDEVARSRIGSQVQVLIDDHENVGRSSHQGPEVDGSTTIIDSPRLAIGTIVDAVVVDTDGVDLIAKLV